MTGDRTRNIYNSEFGTAATVDKIGPLKVSK